MKDFPFILLHAVPTKGRKEAQLDEEGTSLPIGKLQKDPILVTPADLVQVRTRHKSPPKRSRLDTLHTKNAAEKNCRLGKNPIPFL